MGQGNGRGRTTGGLGWPSAGEGFGARVVPARSGPAPVKAPEIPSAPAPMLPLRPGSGRAPFRLRLRRSVYIASPWSITIGSTEWLRVRIALGDLRFWISDLNSGNSESEISDRKFPLHPARSRSGSRAVPARSSSAPGEVRENIQRLPTRARPATGDRSRSLFTRGSTTSKPRHACVCTALRRPHRPAQSRGAIKSG